MIYYYGFISIVFMIRIVNSEEKSTGNSLDSIFFSIALGMIIKELIA